MGEFHVPATFIHKTIEEKKGCAKVNSVNSLKAATVDDSNSPVELLAPEDGCIEILRNVRNYSPSDTASRPRRFAYSATPLREPPIA